MGEMEKLAERCGNCRFYDGDYPNSICRRHAPQVVGLPSDMWNSNSRIGRAWPKVDAKDWCGEFAIRSNREGK